jgi:hypothetical protein
MEKNPKVYEKTAKIINFTDCKRTTFLEDLFEME